MTKPWQWRCRDFPLIGWFLWELILLFGLEPKPHTPPDEPDEKDFRNAA